MPEPYRVAVYYTPEVDDPLWRAGCAWLGRDPESGMDLPRPAIENIEMLTTAPRRYGFHATLKPPMRLGAGLAAFLADVELLAGTMKPFALPPLAVAAVANFIALCPASRAPDLHALADACVTELDRHRQPETAAEQAARAGGRSETQRRNIARWGYPLVFEDWRFHMTLSNAVTDNPLQGHAMRFFGDALARTRLVASLAVFVEPAPGAPFHVHRRYRFGL